MTVSAIVATGATDDYVNCRLDRMRIPLRATYLITVVVSGAAFVGILRLPFGPWDYALGTAAAGCLVYFFWRFARGMRTRRDFVDRFKAQQRKFALACLLASVSALVMSLMPNTLAAVIATVAAFIVLLFMVWSFLTSIPPDL